MILGEATSQGTEHKQETQREEQRFATFSIPNPANMVNVYRVAATSEIKGQSDDFTREKGSWKTSLTFSLQQFKNNTRRSISVTFTAMGKATNITSKAHYAIF